MLGEGIERKHLNNQGSFQPSKVLSYTLNWCTSRRKNRTSPFPCYP